MTLTRQQLIQVLVELPGKLQNAEEEVARCAWEKAKIARRMELCRSQIAIGITCEKGENGKSKYPNEESRKHALELALAEDKEYQQLAEQWEKVLVISEQAECELHHQRYRLKVAELLTQLLVAEGEKDEDRQVPAHSRELRGSHRQADRQARRAEDW